MADGSQHLDAILENATLKHLLEVDGLGSGAGDDEADGRIGREDAGDSGDEEVGAFVIEEARDDDDGNGVVRAEAAGLAGRGCNCGGGRRVGWWIGKGAEVLRNDRVGDHGDHKRVERCAEDCVLFARKC